MAFRTKRLLVVIIVLFTAFVFVPRNLLVAKPTEGQARKLASRLFNRLAGVPLSLEDPRRATIEGLIREGNYQQAARIVTDDDNFYNLTVKHWATPFSSKTEDPFAPLTDFVAMVIGTVRDNRDFREILTGNFTYYGSASTIAPSPLNNTHYANLEREGNNLRKELIRVEPQREDIDDPAGVLTSRGWAEAHLSAGTNRRAIAYAFQIFLCRPIEELGDATAPDSRVRRDVDRKPGGDADTFLSTCRSCHGGMDALGGAYAHFDFSFNETFKLQLLYVPQKVQRKMNQNGNVYPDGHITTDNSWVNHWTDKKNADLGWRGATSGRGIQEFGTMLANSKAFPLCLTKRVFRQTCFREPAENEQETLAKIADKFEVEGYNLRRLFEETAILPSCLGVL